MWVEEELAGKKILRVKVKSPFVWLAVEGGGWVEIHIEGDCCSEEFVDAVRLERTPVLTGKWEEIHFSVPPTSQEVDSLTAVKLFGAGGCVSILHRNSSNGYYGNYMNVNSRGVPPADAEDGKNWFRVS